MFRSLLGGEEQSCASIRRPMHMQFGRALMVFAVAFVLLGVLVGASSCGRDRQVEVDPLDIYRTALKEEFRGDVDLVRDAPRYEIDVTVDPSLDILTGTARIQLTNRSPDPWRHLVFRLYPVLDHYGGQMTVLSALINEEPSQFTYQAQNTAVRVNLLDPLLSGEETVVELSWRLTIPTWSDNPTVYALFGNSQGITSLPLFYPSLAVYEPGPAVGTGHWWLDMGSVRGDSAFNESALFTVTAELPANQVPVATGTLVTTDTTESDHTSYTWVTGPVREFLLHMSPDFESDSMDAYGTTVTTYWLPGDEEAAQAALIHAVGALRFYSDQFGAYPYKDMRIAPAALSYRGMEYPQVSLLGVELYDKYRDDLETLAAHEIAHQWWYQLVHSDPVRTPWLDEALAEFSMGMYFEALHGRRDAEWVEYQRWEVPHQLLIERDLDSALNRPVDDFENSSQYETVVYAKGALLYRRLRNILGDREFRDFLRQYLDRHRYEIVNVDDWLVEIQALEEQEADELYRRWVEAPPAIVPLVDVDEQVADEADLPAEATPIADEP
jgi:hypothetical protein